MVIKARHVPLRRCVVCRSSSPQAELLRLCSAADGDYLYDQRRRLGGRGTWVCRSCAASSNEKRLRQVFKGQAQQVAQLLSHALAAQPPSGHGSGELGAEAAATQRTNGGLNV